MVELEPAQESLARLLLEHPFPDDQGLLFTVDRTVTAGQARQDAGRVAARLAQSGIRPGQAVAVQLPSGPEGVTAMMGIWIAGCVFVPVNPRAPQPEVERILSTVGAAAVLDAQGLHRRAQPAKYEPGVGFVLWSSGTTGTPKAILHTHEGYQEILGRMLGQLRGSGAGRRAPSPNLIPVPLSLNAGIYNTLFGLKAGAAVVLMERFDTTVFAELVGRFAIRSTVLPPAAISMLNDDISLSDLSPLRYVRSITAPLSALEARRLSERFGVFVLNSYGQAELGEVIGWTSDDAKNHPEKLGAAGRPHPGVDLKIDDRGHLWVRPPSHAVGYAGDDGMSARMDEEGFIDTGDLARADSDGFIWIEGRAGDVINRGGNKVHPAEVEEVIRLAEGVVDVAVVRAPDSRLGSVPVAYYEGRPIDSAALEELCRRHLVPYKVPVSFSWCAELPRNEVGKILRNDLEHRAAGADTAVGESDLSV